MAVVRPFCAIRPRADIASSVAALPYDVYSRAEAKAETIRQPLSFLCIDRAESQLGDDVDTYDPRVYEKARQLLSSTRFYTYEGGEGHIPAIHAFVYIALGMQRLERGENEAALESFLEADRLPEYYHEGPKYQEPRAHLHYFKGLGYEACGRTQEAVSEWKKAAAQKDAANESQYYKGLALRRLGDYAAAAKLFARLKETLLAVPGLTEKLILPEACPDSDPSWFGFLLTCREGVSRRSLVEHIEKSGVQTRMLFAGNLTKHPCFDQLRAEAAAGAGAQPKYRVAGGLAVTDRIMRDTFWVGVYPGMTEEKLDYMAKVIREGLGL